MQKPRRKRPQKLQDLPSLFDLPAGPAADIYSGMVAEARAHQITPDHTMSADELIGRTGRRASGRTELEFISFGSGSSGNSAYIGIKGVGGVLIDAGIDPNIVLATLERNCIDTDRIHGILLTHDHSDHVRFAYTLLRKHRHMHLYCTNGTINGILRRHNISRWIKDYHQPVFKEYEFEVGPFAVTPFEVSHDGSDNVGYSISHGGHTFVVATDMGYINDRADHYIRRANHLMIESNYDLHMLNTGTYPEYLKARIRGARGHLDNSMTASYLADIWQPGLTDIYLCHLSHDNNTPETALTAVRAALEGRGVSVGDALGSAAALSCNVQLYALPRFDASPLFIHRITN